MTIVGMQRQLEFICVATEAAPAINKRESE
jgi:hypothetical protein